MTASKCYYQKIRIFHLKMGRKYENIIAKYFDHYSCSNIVATFYSNVFLPIKTPVSVKYRKTISIIFFLSSKFKLRMASLPINLLSCRNTYEGIIPFPPALTNIFLSIFVGIIIYFSCSKY